MILEISNLKEIEEENSKNEISNDRLRKQKNLEYFLKIKRNIIDLFLVHNDLLTEGQLLPKSNSEPNLKKLKKEAKTKNKIIQKKNEIKYKNLNIDEEENKINDELKNKKTKNKNKKEKKFNIECNVYFNHNENNEKNLEDKNSLNDKENQEKILNNEDELNLIKNHSTNDLNIVNNNINFSDNNSNKVKITINSQNKNTTNNITNSPIYLLEDKDNSSINSSKNDNSAKNTKNNNKRTSFYSSSSFGKNFILKNKVCKSTKNNENKFYKNKTYSDDNPIMAYYIGENLGNFYLMTDKKSQEELDGINYMNFFPTNEKETRNKDKDIMSCIYIDNKVQKFQKKENSHMIGENNKNEDNNLFNYNYNFNKNNNIAIEESTDKKLELQNLNNLNSDNNITENSFGNDINIKNNIDNENYINNNNIINKPKNNDKDYLDNTTNNNIPNETNYFLNVNNNLYFDKNNITNNNNNSYFYDNNFSNNNNIINNNKIINNNNMIDNNISNSNSNNNNNINNTNNNDNNYINDFNNLNNKITNESNDDNNFEFPINKKENINFLNNNIDSNILNNLNNLNLNINEDINMNLPLSFTNSDFNLDNLNLKEIKLNDEILNELSNLNNINLNPNYFSSSEFQSPDNYYNPINNQNNNIDNNIISNNIDLNFNNININDLNKNVHISYNNKYNMNFSRDNRDSINMLPLNKSFYEYTEDELLQYAIPLIKDQSGCRFLQDKIKNSPNFGNEKLFDKIKYNIKELGCDPFGNYFLQVLIDILDYDNLKEFLDLTKKDFTNICICPHGTRVVQKTIEKISTKPELIIKFINNINMNDLSIICKSAYGNHIMQKFLTSIHNLENTKFIYDYIYNNFMEIAETKHGVCVIQKCVSEGNKIQRKKLYDLIMKNFDKLIKHQFANYLIQYILINTKSEEKLLEIMPLIKKIEDNLLDYCKSKFSANVIEKCFENNENYIKDHILECLLNRYKNNIIEILLDQYGIYIIQKALKLNPVYKKKLCDIINLKENELRSININDFKYKGIIKIINSIKELSMIFSKVKDNYSNNNNIDFNYNNQNNYNNYNNNYYNTNENENKNNNRTKNKKGKKYYRGNNSKYPK